VSVELADVPAGCRAAVTATLEAVGVKEGHLGVELVPAARIRELNRRFRGTDAPTDVLSFPIDGLAGQGGAPRELGDVVICPEHTGDLDEATVHGVLHLCGYDHETDEGEMLELQRQVLAALGRGSAP
jgi:probable rRNA maturation factor